MKRIFVSTLLVLFLTCSLSFASTDQSKSRALETSILSSFKNLADLHFSSVIKDLDMLAQADQVKSGEWEAMEAILTSYEDEHPYLITVFMKPDGNYWTPKKGKVNKNLSDREYFKPLMSGEKIAFHPLVSRSTGRKAVFCASPVTKDGMVVGAVGCSIFLEELSEILGQSLNLPKGMFYYIVDQENKTIIHYVKEKIFLNPTKQNEPTMNKAFKIVQEKESGVVEYSFKGVPRQVLFTTSPMTGWKYLIGIPQP